MSNDIEICTLDGIKWVLGEESEKSLNWNDAKNWCESIGQELPPREVLLLAYLNPEKIGGFAGNYYWSSTAYDSDHAWYQYYPNGYQHALSKGDPLRVRAVRAIKVAQPEQKLMGEGHTADGFRGNKKATHADSYWAGVNDAEKYHGIGVDEHE